MIAERRTEGGQGAHCPSCLYNQTLGSSDFSSSLWFWQPLSFFLGSPLIEIPRLKSIWSRSLSELDISWPLLVLVYVDLGLDLDICSWCRGFGRPDECFYMSNGLSHPLLLSKWKSPCPSCGLPLQEVKTIPHSPRPFLICMITCTVSLFFLLGPQHWAQSNK